MNLSHDPSAFKGKGPSAELHIDGYSAHEKEEKEGERGYNPAFPDKGGCQGEAGDTPQNLHHCFGNPVPIVWCLMFHTISYLLLGCFIRSVHNSGYVLLCKSPKASASGLYNTSFKL